MYITINNEITPKKAKKSISLYVNKTYISSYINTNKNNSKQLNKNKIFPNYFNFSLFLNI